MLKRNRVRGLPWNLVDKNHPDGCWVWLGSKDKDGYSRSSCGLGHREFYTYLVGEIPDGLQVDHLCRNRSCVNPEHLELVTPKVNTQRGTNHNRVKTHCKHGHEFSPENTRITKRGNRSCKECENMAQRRAYRNRKAA